MDVSWIPIVIIIVGVLMVIIDGIFGVGILWMRNKWIYNRYGPTVARAVVILMGVLIIIMGIYGIFAGWGLE